MSWFTKIEVTKRAAARNVKLNCLRINGLIGKMTVAVVCCVAGFSIGTPARAQQIHDGQSLLTAMHDRYKDSWYDSVLFKEKAITLKPDGTSSTEVWDEVAVLPGKLRIDRGAHREGNGIVLADGTLTRFKDGKPNGPSPFVHMLLVLGFDVYKQPAETTIAQVKAEGIDLSQIHEESWDGQDVYVVGAAKGDLKAKQFWVEKKRLLFVRLLEPDGQDAAKMHDTRFRGYKALAGGWISERVEFYVDGKDSFNEDYFDVKGNVKVDPAIFDPAKYAETSAYPKTQK
jgi:hypothetical protein